MSTTGLLPTEAVTISHHIWETRYRHGEECCLEDSLLRVAHALAKPEGGDSLIWEQRFLDVMRSSHFLPGGRILAGAGTGRRVTLANCFAMGVIEDSIDGIFQALREGALTMQQGGGVGYDFSSLRPRGSPAIGTGATASGPVSFLHVWNSMCDTMLSTGARRGAMMATLRCDHPDIEAFIDAKREQGVLPYFNLSVLVSDAFMAAVRNGQEWALVFPGDGGETIMREWTGQENPVGCRVHRKLDARTLWDRLTRAAYDTAEPGVLFIDRINRSNNLSYCEKISTTNPCGEIPLPPYGACVLGSLNLAAFIIEPFTSEARLDEARLEETARIATRMLDNAISISSFPLPRQLERAKNTRRIGLGIMGLADALMMLGLRYDTRAARNAAARSMRIICHAAYEASVLLARDKGAFPLLRRDEYLAAPFISALPKSIQEGIRGHGIRNSHLTAIAPTGTISLVAGGVSSGLEPVLAPAIQRAIRQADGSKRTFTLHDHAVELWRQSGNAGLLPDFICAEEISPRDHLAMQAALQHFVDSAISKTVTIPTRYSFNAFRDLYQTAFDSGLKGCTAFRPDGSHGTELPLSPGLCDSRQDMAECIG